MFLSRAKTSSFRLKNKLREHHNQCAFGLLRWDDSPASGFILGRLQGLWPFLMAISRMFLKATKK